MIYRLYTMHLMPFMISLRRTPEGLKADLRPKMAKLAVTRELVGKVVCSSYVNHQKLISYSWILATTRAYSPLKWTSSTTAFNARFTLNSRLRTDLRPKMAKLAVTRELVGKVVSSFYVTHQKLINYSWILATTRAYSPLKDKLHDRFKGQKRSWNLSISLASNSTRSWILFGRKFFADWS